MARAYARIDELQRGEIRISLRPAHEALADASAVADRVAAGARLALAGLTLAVKDNVDVAGLPTTAACPRYSYAPDHDACAVARLRAEGAVVLGTTNLDQFATGLAGTRSPHGADGDRDQRWLLAPGALTRLSAALPAGVALSRPRDAQALTVGPA